MQHRSSPSHFEIEMPCTETQGDCDGLSPPRVNRSAEASEVKARVRSPDFARFLFQMRRGGSGKIADQFRDRRGRFVTLNVHVR
jgi:hypothetical protein